MDLSKLPKLSKTQEKQPPPEETGPPFPAGQAVIVPTFGLAEAWVSIALGVLLLFVFPNTIRYLHSSAAFEQNNPVTDAQGNAIPYLNSVFFWTDLGITVFAAALILEGIAPGGSEKNFPAADRVLRDGRRSAIQCVCDCSRIFHHWISMGLRDRSDRAGVHGDNAMAAHRDIAAIKKPRTRGGATGAQGRERLRRTRRNARCSKLSMPHGRKKLTEFREN